MTETTVEEVVEAFENVSGIDVNTGGRTPLVKVNSEDSVGEFFRICREEGFETTSTERDALSYTVLDSWVETE